MGFFQGLRIKTNKLLILLLGLFYFLLLFFFCVCVYACVCVCVFKKADKLIRGWYSSLFQLGLKKKKIRISMLIILF